MFLLELLLDGFVQLVIELLVELGVGDRVLESRRGRLGAFAALGLFGGIVWGSYLHASGHAATPRTLWVSLVLGIGAVLAGLSRRSSAAGDPSALRGGFLPWHWSPHQWDALALLNAGVAIGVFLGFR